MTKAEELANWLKTGEIEEIDLIESAELLLQQQTEISFLKLQVEEAVKLAVKEIQKRKL